MLPKSACPSIAANNHPVRHGPVVGIHNGIIVNDVEILAEFAYARAEPEMTVDSEAILALAAHAADVAAALERLRRAMAAAWIDERVPDVINVARGMGRPLWTGVTVDAVFWSPPRSCSQGPPSRPPAASGPAHGVRRADARSGRQRHPTLRIEQTMSYAKQNLRAVEDSAAKFGLSETQEARFPRADLGAEQSGMNLLFVKPCQREALAHRHRQAEEIYVVLSGSGRVKLDDVLVELAPLDAVRVSPGVARSFEAGREGLEVLIFGPHIEGDSETVADFWEPS